MTTQAQGRSDSVGRLMHEIDPHLDMPMRVLSIDEENMIYKQQLNATKIKC